MSKQKYYRLDRILSTGARFIMPIGERSNGKSFAVKEHCLKQSIIHGREFIYLRRWREDIKVDAVERYFEDLVENEKGKKFIYEWTGQEWDRISIYRGSIYLARINAEGKLERSAIRIGHIACLTGETHYKSNQYPKVDNIIFEEFITDKGYLPNEVKTLVSFVSTVLRRRAGYVFMIGNTISQVCPYFSEWELVNIPKMNQGDIDIYSHETDQTDDDGEPVVVKIAVEFCENSGNNSKMFFGRNSKMITSGTWESKEYPHLERRLDTYDCFYDIYFIYGSTAYHLKLLFDDCLGFFAYVYPCTRDIPKDARVISDARTLAPNTTLSILHKRSKYDILVLRLLKERKVAFSDNLTGTNFFQSFGNI